MVDRHCPFLNRDDPRCAAHFRVNELQHAFEHCAGAYAKCPSYREMLAERIMHRNAASHRAEVSHRAEALRVEVCVGGRPYANERCQPSRPATAVVAATLVAPAAAPRWHVTDHGLVSA